MSECLRAALLHSSHHWSHDCSFFFSCSNSHGDTCCDSMRQVKRSRATCVFRSAILTSFEKLLPDQKQYFDADKRRLTPMLKTVLVGNMPCLSAFIGVHRRHHSAFAPLARMSGVSASTSAWMNLANSCGLLPISTEPSRAA